MNNTYDLDENGIPIIGTIDIEKKVEEVISFFDKAVLFAPQLTPLTLIIERLRTEYKILFDFESDLGESEGKKILGRFSFASRSIAVDRSLEYGSNRWNFTLAHELGHFVFHRKLKLEKEKIRPDTESTLEDFEEKKRTPLEWLEWQANSFASAFLMPRQTVGKALLEYQAEQGIPRNVGKIYVVNDRSSLSEYRKVISHFTLVYQVSRTVAEIRLSNLGYIIDERNRDSKMIDALFRN